VKNLPGQVLQYNSWPAEVLLDGRASSAHPDDAFLVYPGNRPSVRWMLLLRELHNNQKKFVTKKKIVIFAVSAYPAR
jgi:hypothetical protein